MNFPFYYPYFSARHIYPSPLSQFNPPALFQPGLREEQTEIELAVRLKQQLRNTQRIREYQQELRSKQRAYECLRLGAIHADLQTLKRKQLLEQNLTDFNPLGQPTNLEKMPLYPEKADSYRPNKQGAQKQNNQKASEQYQRNIEKYQQELLKKIQNTREYRKLNNQRQGQDQNGERKSKTQRKKEEQKESNREEENIIVNKKPSSTPFKNNKINEHLKYHVPHAKSLKQSKEKYQTIEYPIYKPKLAPSYHNNSTNRKTSFVFQSDRKLQQARKVNKQVNKSSLFGKKQKEQKKIPTEKHKERESLPNEALKKIKNRLKLSLVYQDSHWTHPKQQVDHLLNTYLMEERTRKQIKDKINNNPSILRKHSLVVTSR